MAERKLFCEMNPLFYEISLKKEILKKHIKNLLSKEKIAKSFSQEKLPFVVASNSSHMIKRAPGVNLEHQLNKAVNIRLASDKINGMIIHPGEIFSFWKTIGPITKRRGYKEGRVIKGNKLIAGIGGGLCNLGNTVNLLVLHSPLKITELHFHSDALAPEQGERIPFSSGTSVFYNYLDYRFLNNTDCDIQLLVWCEGETLRAELRSEKPFDRCYRLLEEEHRFDNENGTYYRNSKIYRVCTHPDTGEILEKELVRDNHSKVMYDYSLIPKEFVCDGC